MSSGQSGKTNYNFFVETDTSRFTGEWIAIARKKILAHGPDAKKVYEQGKRKANRARVSLAKIPDKRHVVFSVFP
ncbi:DUF5678 domain-containing protein [Patescibacteria group bacterium]|nr:DUF5678 domain-containing protein [Patescibacteria group bacterium]